MRTTYIYTVLDGQGNVVLKDVRATDIAVHFGISRTTNMKKYATDGILINHEYRVVISGSDNGNKVLSDRLAQCWKFTARMLVEWDCMNHRYGRRFQEN